MTPLILSIFFVNKPFEPQTRINVQKVIQLHNNKLVLKIQDACVFYFLPMDLISEKYRY